jgi:hypothetical protein
MAKLRAKSNDLREGIAWMDNDELLLEIAGAERQVRCYVLRFALSRGSVGEIERDASYQSDDQTCDKYGGKAQRGDVAVVQEGQ